MCTEMRQTLNAEAFKQTKQFFVQLNSSQFVKDEMWFGAAATAEWFNAMSSNHLTSYRCMHAR